VHSRFSHKQEAASPGYYQVFLQDYKINVELTATARTGLQKYRFSGDDNQVRLHLGYTRNWDGVTDSKIKVINDSTIVGYRFSNGWARDQQVYFTSIFSSPFRSFSLSENGELSSLDSLRGKDLLALLHFGDTKEVMVKTGISTVSIENARANVKAEQKGFHFNEVRRKAVQAWEKELQKVNIQASEDNKVQFYTAFYHSMLAPVLISDQDGSYRGSENKVYQATEYDRYSTFSLWDTYRALHPWMTITHPERVPDLLASMMAFYQESGQLPVWSMAGKETNMMIGYHSVPVICDAIFKGFPIDTIEAFQAMKASAMQDNFGLANYKTLGYVPHEDRSWNVSLTMEYAYDDWCIAQVAQLLKADEDYQYFMDRAGNYRHHFDSTTTFFRAKSKDGSFKEGFDPLAYHPDDYCEANAWQYYWYTPQDVDDLIELSGGAQAFEEKLDQMFLTRQAEGEEPEWISGYIGQYVHGNEPSHHVPYLYQYVNAGPKTQQRVRQVMAELYSPQPDGLAGNEDCGQMSAWYLFSALGFYPVNPADGKYILGSPVVEEAIIQLPEGKQFRIRAINQSPENVYVKSVKLNGKLLDQFYLHHQQIMAGGELVFELGPQP
jgi:predicted alpha-1,2-mannosidase